MSEIRRKWPFKLPKLRQKPSSSSTSDTREQELSATPVRDIALLQGAAAANVESSQSEIILNSNLSQRATGSLAIHDRAGPNVTLRGGASGNGVALQAEDMLRKLEGREPRDSLPQSLHANTAIQRESPARGIQASDCDENPKSGLDLPRTASDVPYALMWTEHKVELRPVRPLQSSESPEMSPAVFPRLSHSCTAIPNSAGEFIIFGGVTVVTREGPVGNEDVILLSTVDMSLTNLETTGAKPGPRGFPRAVIAGRVLVVFGGNTDSNYLSFLNLDTREWSNLRPPKPYPESRKGHSFNLVNSTAWLYGGSVRGGSAEDMWCIDLGTERIEHARWRQVRKRGPWPGPRSYHSTVYYDGCLYLFAGHVRKITPGQVIKSGKSDLKFNDLWKFDIGTETWTEVECHGQLPQTGDCHATEVNGDNMFIFGGATQEGIEGESFGMDEAFVFNFRDHTWRSLAILGNSPAPTNSGVLLALGSQLLLVGGQGNSRKQYVHVANVLRGDGYTPDNLAKLQFTTETTKLKFTTKAVDLSRFVRKRGDSAHALAGFSDVWKGEMTDTGQPIAIKVLRVTTAGGSDDPEAGRLRKRFDRELKIWMECQHPRILELLGYAYIEGIPCLISPWCSNGNILEYLARNPGINRLQLVIQVAEGLAYLHGREPPVIHSDVKPANVLISDGGDAKICDFGISKLVMDTPSGFTTTKTAKYTLRYSAKELLCEGRNTMMSDVYAFGMVILEIITDKHPFFKISIEAMVTMAIMIGGSPLTEDYPELPATDPLWDIMRECWKEEPTERATIVTVLGKLRKYAETRED